MFNHVVARTHSTVSLVQSYELYRLLLKDTLGNCQNTWKVETHLQKLHDSDEQFDYKIARDTDFGSATMVVWQTGLMKADFELYGCAPHLNSYSWLYISVVEKMTMDTLVLL